MTRELKLLGMEIEDLATSKLVLPFKVDQALDDLLPVQEQVPINCTLVPDARIPSGAIG